MMRPLVPKALVSKALCLTLPALLFLGLYLRALDFEFVWTDHGEIEAGGLLVPPDRILEPFASPMLPGLAGPAQRQPYYRPVQVIAASLIDHRLGRRPQSFRGVSILVGALTTLAFSFFAASLSRSYALGLAAGVIYAAHPAGVEIYVWIAGLGQALSSLFTIANLWSGVVAMRWLASGRRGPGYALGLLSTGFLLLAMGSKENAVVAPVLLLLCWTADRILARAESAEEGGAVEAGGEGPLGFLRGLAQRASALVVLQLAVAAWFALVLKPGVTGGVLASLKPVAGSMAVQILTGVASWPGTLAWLFLPLQSSTSDVVRVVGSVADAGVLLALGLLGVSVVAWFVLSRRHFAIAALGLAWIWIAFAPTSGVVPLTHPRAVRYVFPAVFGLALFLPAAFAALVGRFGPGWRVVLGALAGALFVGGLAERTWARTPDWSSDLRLFRSDQRRDPLYREGYHMLAAALAREGRLAEARQWLIDLIELAPRFEGHASHLQDAEAMALYCNLNVHLGHVDDNLRFEAQMRPNAPHLRDVPFYFYQCGARTFEARGEADRAIEILRAVVEVDPGPNQALYMAALARNLASQGRDDEARQWLERIPGERLRDPFLFQEVQRARAMLSPGGGG